jgi:hypothetical protein
MTLPSGKMPSAVFRSSSSLAIVPIVPSPPAAMTRS